LTPRIFLLLLLTLSFASFSQVPGKDTLFVRTAVARAAAVYTKSMNGQSNLNKGTEYPVYEALEPNEHAYFGSDEWITGSISYAGEVYENVPMQFDLFREKVVVEHSITHIMMELINVNIKWFTLGDHRFVNMRTDNNKREGFYELLYDGKVKALAKHEKTLQKHVRNNKVTYFFSARTLYYIFKEGSFYPVSSRGSALDALSEKESELKQFLSREKINFKKDRRAALARMAEFYNSITGN
jgi:hypothetical protein